MILHLNTVKGFSPNPVFVRWEAISHIDETPPSATRPGCFIHLIGGGHVWVTETAKDIFAQLPKGVA